MAKSGDKDEFDVLTFFLYVMALLTAIVGAFAAWNYTKVQDIEKKIKSEVRNLDQMQRIAQDEQFRDWLAKEREVSKTRGGGTSRDFKALIKNTTTRMQMVEEQSRTVTRDRDGGEEVTVKVSFKSVRMETLVRWCVTLEEQWPGCRTNRINQLKWDPESETWDVTVEVSIFKAKETDS